VLRAQDANGPLTPPPEHDVHRVTTNQPVEAPPAKPPAEIVKGFAAKEEKFLRARVGYGYKKSIKLTEYGHDGQPSGEFQMTLAGIADSEGRLSEKIVTQPPSTLHALELSPAVLRAVARIPAYPLIHSNFQNTICGTWGKKSRRSGLLIFEAKPKLLERARRCFRAWCGWTSNIWKW